MTRSGFKRTLRRRPQTKITLYQRLPKGDKMEWIIQKCVELGIEKIVAVSTERAIVKLDKKRQKNLERWQKIAEAAAKQSGRGIIPQIGKKVPDIWRGCGTGKHIRRSNHSL